jgi:hypothetical protein
VTSSGVAQPASSSPPSTSPRVIMPLGSGRPCSSGQIGGTMAPGSYQGPGERAARVPHGPFGYTRPVAKSQSVPDRPCSVLAGLCGALTALALVALADAGPAPISSSELLADPDRFDGQVVALQGTVEQFPEKVTPDGAPYFKFLLSRARSCATRRS